MRGTFAILLLLTAARPAAAQDIVAALRAQQWPAAEAGAAAYADPVAGKLVLYYRLLTPNAATAAEITTFLAAGPDWPNQTLLNRRRDEALSVESDDVVALAACDKIPPISAGAELRCADALAHVGRTAAANELYRRAWIGAISDLGGEFRFTQRMTGPVSPDDEWRRFTRLAETDSAAAPRQLLRLDSASRQAGEAILALRQADPRGLALASGLSPTRAHDPFLILEQARYLRKTNQDDAALAAWQSLPGTAMATVDTERQPAFWAERNILARRRLRINDDAGAYALAAAQTPAQSPAHIEANPDAAVEAEFLAGWIALRRQNDPARAAPHFLRLAAISTAVLSQSRAHYWLARTAEARGDKTAAASEFAVAAGWPTTYYGQLAALAAGDTPTSLATRIANLRDPVWENAQAVDFAGREIARAAALLVSWGAPDRAGPFLLRLADVAPGAAERAMAAHLALAFGLPDQAITIARRAGRDGVMLPASGWPAPFEPPTDTIEPALALGLIRQESNFSPTALSPAGARGLMQLMPGTASLVARQLGTRVDLAQLTAEPDINMRLGTAYMQGVLANVDRCLPMAIAAYNAGPSRAMTWAAENGDPRSQTIDPIDWIELIPFNETRNYVQRVIENMVIYRARRGAPAVHPAMACHTQPIGTALTAAISPPR